LVQRFEQGLEKQTSTIQNKLMRFVLDLESRAHISKDHFKC